MNNKLKYFIYSQNSINTYKSCPTKFKYKYIDKINWKYDDIESREYYDSLKVGSEFHLLCERYFSNIPLGLNEYTNPKFKVWIDKIKNMFPMNKKNNKILGMKFYLTKSLMYKYLNFLIINFFNQPEIQNKLTLNSFDTMYNYSFTIANTYSYYLEKLVKNPIYKTILNEFDIKTTFIFSKIHEVNLYNNIFYLNFFKLYFNV